MKLPILLGCAGLLALGSACNGGPAKDPLTGSWTTVFDSRIHLPAGYRDTLRFFGKDSFRIRIYTEAGLQQETPGTYRFDAAKKSLSTVSARGPVSFSVQRLQADTLVLRDTRGNDAVFVRVAR